MMENLDAELISQTSPKTKKGEIFALLLAIPNQKYTIGTTYTSREEQGEFIEVEYNHEFSCTMCYDENRELWYHSIQGAEFRINDQEVNEPTLLKFGNIITIRILGIFNDITFLIKRRTLQSQWLPQEGISENENGNEMHQNYLVICSLLGYLPVSDLKSCRLVCKLWNEEGRKLVEIKSNIKFPHEDFTDPLQQITFFRYFREMETFRPRNITLESIPYTDKLQDDAIWLFQQDLFSKLKSISLGLGLGLFGGILQPFILSIADQIEELAVEEETWTVEFPAFKKLKQLRVKPTQLPEGYKTVVDASLLVPKIKHISGLYLCRRIRESEKNFYGTIMEDITEFKNLTEIHLTTLDQYTATQLNKIGNQLKVLEMGEFEEPVSNVWLLEQLLRKYCQSLEKLQFKLPLIYCTEGPSIGLPKFPKLKSFHLEFLIEKNCKPFSFNNGLLIPYPEYFPELQNLAIEPKIMSAEISPVVIWARLSKRGIIGQFFPKTSNFPVCSTLKYLQLPFVRFLQAEEDANAYSADLSSFWQMFPNIQSSWLNN